MHSGVIFPPGLYGNIWPSRRCVRPQENLTSWSGSSCRYPPAPCPCFPPAPASPSSWRTKDRGKTQSRPPRRRACGFSRKSLRSGRRLAKVAQYALPVVFDFLYFQRPPRPPFFSPRFISKSFVRHNTPVFHQHSGRITLWVFMTDVEF